MAAPSASPAGPTSAPFVLLDDAHGSAPAPARLYRNPREVVVARHPGEVSAALARIGTGDGEWAGYLAYEAGLALEPRLAGRLPARAGAAGPLVWFARFDGHEAIPAADVPARLADLVAAREPGPAPRLGPMVPQLSMGGYARAFEAVHEAIVAGDIYQANLTFPLAGAFAGDPLALYAAMRADAGAGFGGAIWDGSHWLLSFSPELFFTLDGDRAMVRPMKGTAPRGRDAAEDAANVAALAANPKDRAENLMIVDLMRNDLSRVAVAGTVKVDAPFAVETYPTVHQMVTTVRATLQPGEDARSLLAAIFPCGSITGAPKIRAMELLGEAERDARGAYCGAIGRIDSRARNGAKNGAGEAAFNVAIRTLRLDPRLGRAVMGVGSAVVADSTMIGERRECVVKGSFLRMSASGADLIETMAFAPESGIALLELHLERMKASAAALGFAFDRHALRNAIQALCFDLEVPARLRLVVSKSGAHALETSPLPSPPDRKLVCAVLPLPVAETDWRLRHKTTDRSFYEEALAAAKAHGADEALFVRDDGLVTEGTFTNLFVGEAGAMLTPAADLGLLPGVLRRSLIEAGEAREAPLTLADLAGGFHLGNALRGLMPAVLLGH